MSPVARIIIAVVALEHLGFLWLEMFQWTKPLGLKIFRNTPEAAASSRVLAMNQGLYNGFLAAGLAWALLMSGPEAVAVARFFLSCVVVAGAFGAATVSLRILFIQSLPAAAALVALALG